MNEKVKEYIKNMTDEEFDYILTLAAKKVVREADGYYSVKAICRKTLIRKKIRKLKKAHLAMTIKRTKTKSYRYLKKHYVL